jgi:transposase
VFIPTPSGRNRYNVLGVVDAITHNFISVCNTTYINHLSVIELLEKIRELHKDSVIPISIFLDNAKYFVLRTKYKYQRCKAVAEKAATLNTAYFVHSTSIELMFLPSYSPNLNLIERIWKWTKKDCLNCKYYGMFTEFKTAILVLRTKYAVDNSLNKIKTGQAQKDLDTLMALNFQLFK